MARSLPKSRVTFLQTPADNAKSLPATSILFLTSDQFSHTSAIDIKEIFSIRLNEGNSFVTF